MVSTTRMWLRGPARYGKGWRVGEEGRAKGCGHLHDGLVDETDGLEESKPPEAKVGENFDSQAS